MTLLYTSNINQNHKISILLDNTSRDKYVGFKYSSIKENIEKALHFCENSLYNTTKTKLHE